MTYTWDTATVGDTSPPHSVHVTADQIADYCRAARYENLVYTNQPAARETGLPGIIAPPAMVLACAPPRLSELAAAQDYALPPNLPLNPVSITLRFQGAFLTPDDTLTTQTRLTAKHQKDGNRYLTFTTTARNQSGAPVAEHDTEYLWEREG